MENFIGKLHWPKIEIVDHFNTIGNVTYKHLKHITIGIGYSDLIYDMG